MNSYKLLITALLISLSLASAQELKCVFIGFPKIFTLDYHCQIKDDYDKNLLWVEQLKTDGSPEDAVSHWKLYGFKKGKTKITFVGKNREGNMITLDSFDILVIQLDGKFEDTERDNDDW